MFIPKSARFLSLFVALSLGCSAGAGPLVERLRGNETMVQAFNLRKIRKAASFAENAQRTLAVADLITIAGMQLEFEGPLAFDRADAKILARHFRAFSDAMIGGRAMRQAGHFGPSATIMDDIERKTWNDLDRYLDPTQREALKKAYPGVVRALTSKNAFLKSKVILGHWAAVGLDQTEARFGSWQTHVALLSSYPSGFLIKLPWIGKRILGTMDVAMGLLGLARYLRVPPESGFCADALEN